MMRYYFSVLFVTVLFMVPWLAQNNPSGIVSLADSIEGGVQQMASLFVPKVKTVKKMQVAYEKASVTPTRSPRIRVLVVPGHEPKIGGAEYGKLKERDMTVEFSAYLTDFLNEDQHYEVFSTRDADGWHPTFATYFKNYWDEIGKWKNDHINTIKNLRSVGQFESKPAPIQHNKAPDDTAQRLFGITKWSNENNIDIMVHVHFNDYPRKSHKIPGKYAGFTIYIPETNYGNSSITSALAQTVFDRLAKYNPVSNFPGENTGIVPDQDLIALGSYNSAKAASMLIEYGYIYEPQFATPELRAVALKDLAYQTYLGLQDFFEPQTKTEEPAFRDTLVVPMTLDEKISKESFSKEVYVLQTALLASGFYPPPQKTISDCPRTGTFGPCTVAAIKYFQEKKEIKGEEGKIGPKTLSALNAEFGAK